MRCNFKLTGRVNGNLHEMRCTRWLCRHVHWSRHAPEKCARTCRVGVTNRGLGDTIAWLIKLATFGYVKPCNACNSRRAKLNRLFPYR